jgi:glycine hydroxymethyltransferase
MALDQSKEMLETMVSAHAAYRASTLNLIASENSLSPTATSLLGNDLVGRYADYPGRDLSARRYRGNRHIVEIESLASDIARRVFGADNVELRPLGGHLAGVALLMALCQPGDTVVELGREGGGHRLAGRMEGTTFPLRTVGLPFDPLRMNVDIDQARSVIAETRPNLIVLGSSSFLFPHPVAEIATLVEGMKDTHLAYDASHVMGFLASGCFQDPLSEGADIVFGSTHKTLPGPQGGIIFSNDAELMDRVTAALTPALVTNHHAFRIPSLALSLLEMEQWGAELYKRTVRTGNSIGAVLEENGVPCVRVDDEYTRSHTVLASVSELGGAELAAARLEEAGIITNSARIPDEWGGEGIRLGLQEVTRRGADDAFAVGTGELIAGVLHGDRSPGDFAHATGELVSRLGPVGFTWSASTSDHV